MTKQNLIAALASTDDELTDSDYLVDIAQIREAVEGLGESVSQIEIVLFWRWRSNAWSAGWISPFSDAETLDWWAQWRNSGRMERDDYDY